MVNDDVTDHIQIRKWIAQGFSLSAILFILAIEPMLRLARKDKHIASGVQLGQTLHLKDMEHLPSITDLIYADDVNAPCTSLDALRGWINTLDQFNKISGLKKATIRRGYGRMVGSAYLTLSNDNLCLSKFGEKTQKSISECPLLNSLTVDYTSNITICGIIYSITNLLKDPEHSSSFLFKKSWSNRASGACSRFQARFERH